MSDVVFFWFGHDAFLRSLDLLHVVRTILFQAISRFFSSGSNEDRIWLVNLNSACQKVSHYSHFMWWGNIYIFSVVRLFWVLFSQLKEIIITETSLQVSICGYLNFIDLKLYSSFLYLSNHFYACQIVWLFLFYFHSRTFLEGCWKQMVKSAFSCICVHLKVGVPVIWCPNLASLFPKTSALPCPLAQPHVLSLLC